MEKQKYYEIANKIKTASFNTKSSDNAIISRPMHTMIESEIEPAIWMFTKENSDACEHILNSPQCSIFYSEPANNTFMSVVGTAEIVRDKKKMGDLWHPMMRAWYPDGIEDDSIVLIKFTPQSAKIWDGPDSQFATFLQLSFSILKGEQYKPSAESYGTVSF